MRLLIISILFSSFSFAKTVSNRKIDDLMQRMEKLEQRVSRLEQAKSSGPRKKDLGNQIIDSQQDRSTASSSSSTSTMSGSRSISETQKQDIMKQLKSFKEKDQERQKFLEKLLNDE